MSGSVLFIICVLFLLWHVATLLNKWIRTLNINIRMSATGKKVRRRCSHNLTQLAFVLSCPWEAAFALMAANLIRWRETNEMLEPKPARSQKRGENSQTLSLLLQGFLGGSWETTPFSGSARLHALNRSKHTIDPSSRNRWGRALMNSFTNGQWSHVNAKALPPTV